MKHSVTINNIRFKNSYYSV